MSNMHGVHSTPLRLTHPRPLSGAREDCAASGPESNTAKTTPWLGDSLVKAPGAPTAKLADAHPAAPEAPPAQELVQDPVARKMRWEMITRVVPPAIAANVAGLMIAVPIATGESAAAVAAASLLSIPVGLSAWSVAHGICSSRIPPSS